MGELDSKDILPYLFCGRAQEAEFPLSPSERNYTQPARTQVESD